MVLVCAAGRSATRRQPFLAGRPGDDRNLYVPISRSSPPKLDASISAGIKRTKLRLVRCKVRMGMNDRDRLRDARADKNLDDVDRIPPPWEPQVTQPQSQIPDSVPPTPSSPLSRGVPVPQSSNGVRGISV